MFTSEENIVTEEIIIQAQEKMTGENLETNSLNKCTVQVSMLSLRWFFNNKENFVAFSKLLKNQSNKVYSS